MRPSPTRRSRPKASAHPRIILRLSAPSSTRTRPVGDEHRSAKQGLETVECVFPKALLRRPNTGFGEGSCCLFGNLEVVLLRCELERVTEPRCRPMTRSERLSGVERCREIILLAG